MYMFDQVIDLKIIPGFLKSQTETLASCQHSQCLRRLLGNIRTHSCHIAWRERPQRQDVEDEIHQVPLDFISYLKGRPDQVVELVFGRLRDGMKGGIGFPGWPLPIRWHQYIRQLLRAED